MARDAAGFVPPVDIYEDEHKLVLKLEIPGMRQEDLDVRMENNTLSVKGERNFQSEGKEENFHRVERRYGSFYRAFTVRTPSTRKASRRIMMPESSVWNCRRGPKASPSRSR